MEIIAWFEMAICLVTGAVTGFIAGLFGVGGGTIVVPVMMLFLERTDIAPSLIMPLSVGTSLASIFFTGSSATFAQLKMKTLNMVLVKKLTLGMMMGAMLGAVVSHYLPFALYKGLMGLFLFWVAIQMFFQLRPEPSRSLPSNNRLFFISSIIGLFSSLFGIGGGVLTVPYLVWCQVKVNEAVATASACGLPIALSGAVTYAVLGFETAGLPKGSTGFILWPAVIPLVASSVFFAPFGARLSQHLPTQQLKKYFALFLLLVSLRLIASLFN